VGVRGRDCGSKGEELWVKRGGIVGQGGRDCGLVIKKESFILLVIYF